MILRALSKGLNLKVLHAFYIQDVARATNARKKKRKVYEPSLVILNNPRLIYNNEEKTCQSNENPEAEQKEVKEKDP
jgi:hypothetical protein